MRTAHKRDCTLFVPPPAIAYLGKLPRVSRVGPTLLLQLWLVATGCDTHRRVQAACLGGRAASTRSMLLARHFLPLNHFQ